MKPLISPRRAHPCIGFVLCEPRDHVQPFHQENRESVKNHTEWPQGHRSSARPALTGWRYGPGPCRFASSPHCTLHQPTYATRRLSF